MEVMVIGVAGGTGSGKTTITKRLMDELGDNISVVYHDNYYKRHDEMTYDERAKLNYDHPDAFDTDLMIEHIRQLKEGNAVDCPIYDFTVHNRSNVTVKIRPSKVILVEGILIFQNIELVNLLDIKILSTPTPMCGSFAAFCATSKSGDAHSSRSPRNISPPSSPCTSSSWSRASATQISLSSKEGTISWRSR